MITVNSMKKVIGGGEPYEFHFKGTSSDTKPFVFGGNAVAINSWFFEEDTTDFYYFDGNGWTKIGEAPVSEAPAKPMTPPSDTSIGNNPNAQEEP